MPHGEADLERAFREAVTGGDSNALPPAFTAALAKGLVKAVEFASDHATDSIINTFRWRVVIQSAVVTAVVVAAICIPVTYLITNESFARERTQAREGLARQQRQAHNNCANITGLAAIEAANDAKSDANAERFERESKDRLGLSPQAFKELVAAAKTEREERLQATMRIASATCAPP